MRHCYNNRASGIGWVFGIVTHSQKPEVTKPKMEFSPFIACPNVYLNGEIMKRKVETCQSCVSSCVCGARCTACSPLEIGHRLCLH